MKRILHILVILLTSASAATSQVILNEMYTIPNANNHEFFELYNPSTSSTPQSLNNYSILTFFDDGVNTGFYVMDLPNISIGPKSFVVGSAANPFSVQGTATAQTSFSWNDAAFMSANQGYVRKWIKGTSNLTDGNLFYDQVAVPATLNDFMPRRTGSGFSYATLLFQNGILINAFQGGTNITTMHTLITSMPALFVDMAGSGTDYTVNFAGYVNAPVEATSNDAGSDNGFMRKGDGKCGVWEKSAANVYHTPLRSNGPATSFSGSVNVAYSITRGNSSTPSTITYNVTSATTNVFPVQMQVYNDNGPVVGELDAGDTFIAANTEYVLGDGPFTTSVTPYNANLLIVVKTAAGCLDNVIVALDNVVLASTFLSFTLNKAGEDLNLNWVVANNEEVKSFEMEESFDGINYSKIGEVEAVAGLGKKQYGFIDRHVIGKRNYRIKMILKKGQPIYSKVVTYIPAVTNTNNSITLLGNPVKERVNISYESGDAGNMSVMVYNMAGRAVASRSVIARKGVNTAEVAVATLPAGMYILEISKPGARMVTRFVKN